MSITTKKEAQNAPSPNNTRNRGGYSAPEAFCQKLWGILERIVKIVLMDDTEL